MSKISGIMTGANQPLLGTPSFNNNKDVESVDNVKSQADQYNGGTITVNVSAADTQETIAKSALLAHAKTAGLSDAEAKNFADTWAEANRQKDGNVYLYKFKPEGLRELSKTDFDAIKATGKWEDSLNPQIHHRIIADLNDRIWNEQNPVPGNENAEVITVNSSEEGAIIKTDGDPSKATDADKALTAYVEQTFNKDGKVLGDKINQIVNIAKNQGVKLESVTASDDGQTAKVYVSAEGKAALQKLFDEAVVETENGNAASDEGQREGTRKFGDIGRVYWNAAIKAGQGIMNMPSDIGNLILSVPPMPREGGFASAKVGGLPEIDARLAKPEPPPSVTTQERLAQAVQDDPNSLAAKIAEKSGYLKTFDFSGALLKYQSEQFNKDITGKVNPDGVTLGKATDTTLSIAAPMIAGKVFAPVEAPQTLDSLGALPKTQIASSGNIFKSISSGTTPFDPIKLQKIQANLEKRGVAFVTGEEGERLAAFYGAESFIYS